MGIYRIRQHTSPALLHHSEQSIVILNDSEESGTESRSREPEWCFQILHSVSDSVQDEYSADIHIIFVFLQAVALRPVWKSAALFVRPGLARTG